jgi:hypothetical protein
MYDGNKDINGLKNKNKIDKDNMNKKKLNFFQSLWNIRIKIIREYISRVRLKLMKL